MFIILCKLLVEFFAGGVERIVVFVVVVGGGFGVIRGAEKNAETETASATQVTRMRQTQTIELCVCLLVSDGDGGVVVLVDVVGSIRFEASWGGG